MGGGGGSQTVNVEAITPAAAEVFGQAWHTQPADPNSYTEKWFSLQDREINAWEVLAGIIGTVGIIQQYNLNQRQVDLQERAVDQAQEYLELAQDNYNNISVPTFERMRDFFDNCGLASWKTHVENFLDLADDDVTYDPKYDLAEGRAISTVQAQFDKARTLRGRMRGRFRTGKCCAEDTMFAIASAQAKVAAANVAYRYEDQKAFEVDQWYWQKQTAGGQLAMNGLANAVSGLNGGAGVATTGLGAIAEGTRSLTAASAGAADAIGNLASFWGNISNGAFGILGYGMGRDSAAGGVFSGFTQAGGGGGGTPHVMRAGQGGKLGGAGLTDPTVAAPYRNANGQIMGWPSTVAG